MWKLSVHASKALWMGDTCPEQGQRGALADHAEVLNLVLRVVGDTGEGTLWRLWLHVLGLLLLFMGDRVSEDFQNHQSADTER